MTTYLYLPFFLLIILYGLMGRSLIYYDKNLWFAALETWVIVLYYVAFIVIIYALQGKSHLCNPFLGIARPQSKFPHSCVCERFIFTGLIHIFPCSRIGRLILEIYKSLTDI
jgi:hypothetical protein